MRPACRCVCLCGYCIYIFPGNVKVSRSKEINISSFLTQYTTHELIVATALRKKKKKKKKKTHSSAIQWTELSCAICVCQLKIEPAFLTCPTYLLICNICFWTQTYSKCVHSHINQHSHNPRPPPHLLLLPFFFFLSKMIDESTVSGVLIACFYGITSLEQVGLYTEDK